MTMAVEYSMPKQYLSTFGGDTLIWPSRRSETLGVSTNAVLCSAIVCGPTQGTIAHNCTAAGKLSDKRFLLVRISWPRKLKSQGLEKDRAKRPGRPSLCITKLTSSLCVVTEPQTIMVEAVKASKRSHCSSPCSAHHFGLDSFNVKPTVVTSAPLTVALVVENQGS